MSNVIQNDIVLSSRVRLARNYDDLPFSTIHSQGIATVCVQRTLQALNISQSNDEYTLYTLRDLGDVQKKSLMESHLVSRDLLQHNEVGAALIRSDQALSIMMNEEDHLRIQSIQKGQDLPHAAELAYLVEATLEKQVRFAFDNQLGYLTACPTNTGTGMRASLMVHLPLLTLFKQMGNVGQSIAKVGLTIRGMYGEGSDALGNVYQVSNQVTLGRTENEIIEAVTAVGRQLTDMERSLRQKAETADNMALEDQTFRAYGLLRYARRISSDEFMQNWSNVRLGAAMGKLPITIETADQLLEQAQDAHIMQWAEKRLKGDELNKARAARIRDLLNNE